MHARAHARTQMIAGDGGYRRTPVPFPRGGLFMGVAERYEVACDLSYFDNQTLYWWNTWVAPGATLGATTLSIADVR